MFRARSIVIGSLDEYKLAACIPSRVGNVVCPALRFQGNGSAVGIIIHQYSIVLHDVATSPLSWVCVGRI